MNADEQRQIRAEAAHWLAMLHSGDMTLQNEAEFDQWQRRSPEHARCIQQINERIASLQGSALRGFKGEQLNNALNRSSSRRAFVRGSLAVAGAVVATTLIGRSGRAGFAWPGDLYTGVGERSEFSLQDGSQLSLNAVSRASPRMSAEQRALALHAGELMITVQDERRPFWLSTSFVSIRAQHQRLLLRQQAQSSYVVALEGDLQLRTSKGWSALSKGHWASINASGDVLQGKARHDDTLWLRGLLEADNQPLEEVVRALRPYRSGIIQLSPAIADLRISGLLPLDDTNHALAMLASIAPISVTRVTDLWVRLEAV